MTQIKPKNLKTCLRYPGGKSKTLKVLSEFIPDGIKEFRDPFLGGGSVPLMFSQNCPETPVWVNDKYWVLYNFWVTLRDRGEELSDSLSEYIPEMGDIPGHEKQFYECREMLSDESVPDFEKAKAFYIINKTSYSGLTERGTFSPGTVNRGNSNNLTQRGIAKLKEFSKVIQNWKITNDDYEECMLSGREGTFVFLDPPYDIKSFLYGGQKGDLHAAFSHQEFADKVDKCPHRFMITYNINDWIVERYNKYQQTKFNIRYSMNHKEGDGNLKEELLIHNYDLPC
jgi:DNA adenine methylase